MLKSIAPSEIFLVSAAPGPDVTYWMSVKPSARSSSSAMYCGALQRIGIFFAKRTVVVSSPPPPASTCRARTSPAPARAKLISNRRRVCNSIGILRRSRLEFAFDLIQEPPVRALRDDLVGSGFDQTDLVQAQRIEPRGVFGIVFPPPVVRELAHRLRGIGVTGREVAIDHAAGDPEGFDPAEVRRLEDCAHHPLGCHRMLAHEFAVSGQHAAKILRPRPVGRRAEDHVACMAGAQLLGFGREPEEGIDLALREKL